MGDWFCQVKYTYIRKISAHTNGTMDNSVIVKNEKRPSSVVLFSVIMLATLGLGLAIAYCSGIMKGTAGIAPKLFSVPDWVVIAIPPVMFFELALGLFFTLRENIYTASGRMLRVWTWIFWCALFLMTAFTPYFIFNGMPIAAYIMATITAALGIGTTIMVYRQTLIGGMMMTVFLAISMLVMIYLGYWVFA